jgi:tryptophanyl-tRNA synthetase
MAEQKRILSGIRPTGQLHLGNLYGALKNWVKLQAEYRCFYFIADWHALTTEFENTSIIQPATKEIIKDWLAAGLDPEKSVIFVQSQIKEHAELYLLLGMLVTVSRLERVPSYKDFQQATGRELCNYGFLGYPVLQSADILMYRAHGVPVGEDQVPHIELTRELARRFNTLYGEIFPEPQPLLTQAPRVPGTDGRKMSKSYGNAIYLSDPPELITQKLKTMMTDPARKRRADKGDPEKCPVWDLHKIFSDEQTRNWVMDGCKSAGIGCLDCKGKLIPQVIQELEPMRKMRLYFDEHPSEAEEILEEGNKKARAFARETMQKVREAMKL